MNIYNSKTYCSDLKKTLSSIQSFEQLKNKSIFITGCTGLICSSLIDLLINADQEFNFNIKLFLAVRNLKKTQERFENNQTYIDLVEYDATCPIIFNHKVDYFIHGASPASPDLFLKAPVDTMLSNIFGLKEILDNALKNKSRTLYISSSEVYGKIQTSQPIEENACGSVEILNSRSSYGQSKRAAETLCAAYISQFNSDIVIARPGHIYGPTASRADNRVSSSFMYDAFDGKDLILKSKGDQLRSYTYCLDCASAILFVLLKGKSGEAYNISNPNSICTIADMAKAFAKYSKVNLKFELPADEEKKAFNPMNNSSLNSTKLEALGWKPTFNKEEGFEHSIKILKELQL